MESLMSSILEIDLAEMKYKWEQGEFHSCQIHDEGRMSLIYEIIIAANIGKLSKDFTYYKILYEGDLEEDCDFDEVKDDFVRVQPKMKLQRVWEEV